MNEFPMHIQVSLANDDVVWQLAQFCKRIGFDTCYELTEAHLSSEERSLRAYQMLAGVDAIGAALKVRGVAPR